ncbi:tRNA 2-thiocytidine biosynthesis protein TtcA [Thermotomaculum hydrothermale]|uniref:tRNA 2-thiocytidine biosynthesis protein TtcA n=1 Tax=Thermotomaculum hydrothermale TaxID=981385 RepID=A0A7R6SZB0_9BACT|nr:ATP-binding protein [Thermotomaculum hydrothermale]BBB32640.1 tRNA 2-thiocytidine biosynthesis protein TtcA [Thermotomaculum hydrothermale]
MENVKNQSIYKRIFKKFVYSILEVDKVCGFLGKDVVVGVSGGLDSLSLYTFLKEYYKLRKFEGRVYGVNVVLGKGDLKPVRFDDVINIFPERKDFDNFNCSLCARLRKIEVFKFCEGRGIKFVAFGHIANDYAENFIWNALYHKRLESMPLCRNYFNGKFFVVRPFAFVFKKDILRYANLMVLKDIEIKCELKNRVRQDVREFLNKMETDEVSVYKNLLEIIKENKFYGE